MIEFLSGAFITLFVIIDPIGVVPVFVALTKGDSEEQKRAIALRATIISAIVLMTFAFIGDFILDTLKISEPSFRIAGGVLLLLTAIDMVVAKHSGISSATVAEQEEAKQRQDISVFPLAIPLIAGPGGLVSIVILMREVEKSFLTQLSLMGVLMVVVALTYICLVLSGAISRFLGVTGANVLGRVFGIILAALAIQFVIDGLKLSF